MKADRVNNRKTALKTLGLALILTAVYLVVAVPFKVMSVIPGFTDIRPVQLLSPVFGIFFGIPGCAAFAVGNLICDIISDSLRWSSIAGFAANFLGPFICYIFYRRISRRDFCLRTGKDLMIYCCVTLVKAVTEALIITPFVAMTYPEVDFLLFACTVMINGTLFPVFLGIPLIILIQEELGFKPYNRLKKDMKG